MKPHPRSLCSTVFLAPLSVVAQACLVALLVNGNAWSQANPINTAAGQYTAKSGSASLVSGLPNGQTVIRLDNTKSVLEWARLNVAQGNSLQFIQPNQQSVVLNRVKGSDATRIDGNLLSNGHVWLLNPSGVLFGAKSSVNVQSLLATTRAISDSDFLTNKLHFSGVGSGQVSNAGVIAVGEGGYVVLTAQSVENTGNIQAQLGQVHLASGKAFVIDLNGDKLLRFDVTQALSPSEASEALVKNTGNVLADGGRVQMTSRTANGLVGQVVNTAGLLQANSVRSVNGEIILDAGLGGKTTVGGTLSVQGTDANSKGGDITALGDNIQIATGARINASGQVGGGKVLIGGDWQGSGSLQQAKTVEMQASSEIKANATQKGDGGTVVLWTTASDANTQTNVDGSIQALPAAGGWGGKIETSGGQLSVTGQVAAGPGGLWLLDPSFTNIDGTNNTTIANNLNAGTDVTVQAASGGALRVLADVTTNANPTTKPDNTYATLTLDGANTWRVLFERKVTVTKGVNVVINSGGDVRFNNVGANDSGVETDTGNITINANSYLFTTTRLSGDSPALKTQDGTISSTSRFAVLGHGAIEIEKAGKASIVTTGVTTAGEANGLPAGVGVVFYRDGTIMLPGYTANYVDSTSTNSVVRIVGGGTVLINAKQGIVTSGNYNEGTSTFTAYDSAVAGTGVVNKILRSDDASGSFVLAAPEIRIPQWTGAGNYVYTTNGGKLGFVSMDNASAQVGNYDPTQVQFFALQKLEPTSAQVVYNATKHTGDNTLVKLLAGTGMAAYSINGIPAQSYQGTNASITASTVGVNAGNQGLVIDAISINGVPFFSLPIAFSKSITVNRAALTLAAQSQMRTYNGLLSSSTSPQATGLAGSDNITGLTQSFDSKNAGARTLSVNNGFVVNDGNSGNNYNVTLLTASGTINPAALTVTASVANKSYDGNVNATVSTSDNRLGNDDLTISSSASFLDPLVGNNKPVNVTGISISGTDAANYLLANTTANTTATITPSQTNAAVQAAISASLPSAAATTAFASPVVSSFVTSSSTSVAAAKTSTSSGTSSTSTQTVSGASATSTSASGVTPSSSSSGTTTDEVTNTALTAQNATSATTVTANSAATAPATTAAISVSTQTVPRTAAVAATQATTAAQSTAVTTGVATSNTSNQVQIVSLNTSSSRVTPPVGAQTIAPVQTPKSAEDQSDPVLAAVSSFKPATPASSNNRAPTRGRDAPVVVPLVQGVLVMETSPPKAATQAVDEQRLSASGDRSRW
jgi:filamentous hemagglutinin family protein